MNQYTAHKKRFLFLCLGSLVLPLLWITIKYGIPISDRFLPTPSAVIRALYDFQPSIMVHLGYTTLRLLIGSALGLLAGIILALIMSRGPVLHSLLSPSVQSLRSIPAAAVVPFFLLWFGFAEWGRYLLVVTTIAFNIAIASHEILQHTSDNHAAAIHSFRPTKTWLLFKYQLPRILEGLLPTLRFSLALAIGAVTVSELLGSQIGMGYLIQTSRSTFSLDALFLATLFLGILNGLADRILISAWNRLVFWRNHK